MVRSSGNAPLHQAAFLARLKALLAHESGDAAATAAVPLFEQILTQTRRAVGVAALSEGLRDLEGEDLVLLAAGTVVFLEVIVEATAADTQGETELLERELAAREERLD